MDTSTETALGREEPIKKSPYDDLSREDLIKKCKGLLAIAQKAKLSKQELQTEVDHLKQQLDRSVKENFSDSTDDNLRTLQELVDSLTEQKLNYITDLDSANGRVSALSAKLKESQLKLEGYEGKVTELSTRLSDLDNEVVSLRRQNQRLVSENEELISQLGELEARAEEFNQLGLQQREQLHKLEETVDKGASSEIIEEYQKKFDAMNEQIASLENDLATQNEKLADNELDTKSLNEKLSQETKKYEYERDKKEKANTKLKSYREKLIKCSSSITQLKNTKFILLKTVKDYSESIPKWQDDMVKISNMLSNQFSEITCENNTIKEQILQYEENLNITKCSIEELRKRNMQLQQNNNDLNKMIEDLKRENTEIESYEMLNLQIKALESEKHILVKEKQAARDGLIELETQNKKHITDIRNLHSNIESLESRSNFLECENKTLKHQLSERDTKQCKELKEKLKSLQEQFDALKTENTNIADLNNLLQEEVETLKSSLETPTEDGEQLSDLNVSMQTDIMKLETKLAAYKQENSSLLSEMKESRIKIKEMSAATAELEDVKSKMLGYKTENTELLNEMKEVNQVLKERGESISKQEKAIAEMERLVETLEKDRAVLGDDKSEMEKRVKELETELEKINLGRVNQEEELAKVKAECQEMQQDLTYKETEVIALKEEIDKLKQQQIYTNMDHPNEDMSTSTISRAEEHGKMKELDEAFEFKYTKLRALALKLKKRLIEIEAQLHSTEEERARLQTQVKETDRVVQDATAIQEAHSDRINEQANEIQRLSKENFELSARLRDSIRTPVNEQCIKANTGDLANTQDVRNIEISQCITNDGDVVKASTVGDDSESVKELKQKLEALMKELESVKESGEELEKLKAEISNKESQLSSEVEQHRMTRAELEKTRREVKKKSVLSLEMEDYERSMKELTSKMQDNKNKMVQMESTIDTQQGTITSLKTQIKLLEDQIKTEEDQNRITKEELHAATEAVQDKENVVQVKNEVIVKLEQEIETGKRAYEDLNIEMGMLLGEKEKVILSLSQDKLELGGRLKRAESRSTELDESLRVTNIELEDLKTEFASYKVRAQAVLRQNQTVDHSQEERLKEELAALRSQFNELQARFEATSAELEELRTTSAAERRRTTEATNEVARAQQRTARLHADLQKITQQLDAERTHAKLQLTTLTQCYKNQLSELEARHEKETIELKSELEQAREAAKVAAGSAADYLVPIIANDSDGELDVNVSMLPREEGEGSEAAPSPPPSKPYATTRSRSPVPLERLLEEGVPADEGAGAGGAPLGPQAEQELQDMERKLRALVQRVEHVTLLLAESERECARHAQLAELLKSEVRRARGAQQAHNTQYMKNVTLKFLTLPAGDERSRLVPVLQKLLTLSNEETHALTAVARGQDPSGKSGWGSYLPWSGK